MLQVPEQAVESCVEQYLARLAEARDAILATRVFQPSIAIVLGSGLGPLAEKVEHATRIPYSHIPHFPTTHADGHAGNLVLGYLAGMPIAILQGRGHRYEGNSNSLASFPVFCLHALGAETLITTNAAGGLNPRFQTGDLMVLDSHLDFLWPRVHEQHCEWSRLLARRCSQENRYVSLRNGDAPYDWRLIQMLHSIAQREGIKLHQGCYLGTLGPTYETRSEYRMFRWLGADAVGMSTIPEVLAAKSLQMQVLALSVITNVACPDLPQSTTHQEVVDSGRAAGPRLLTLISGLLQQMAGPPD